MKYPWIQHHRDTFPVVVMCRVLEVSDSGYYDWQRRKPSPRADRTAKIRGDVREVFEQSQGIYGSRKIVEALEKHQQLESACRNTVVKAMRQMGLRSCVTKTFKPTPGSRPPRPTPIRPRPRTCWIKTSKPTG